MDEITEPVTATACPDCHARVEDLVAHKLWHSRLVASIAKAVEHELKRPTAASG